MIYPDGKNTYFATLPIKAMVDAIRQGGLPASVSNSAGTFVCNHLMYGLLHTIETKYPELRLYGGFIHVPFLPNEVITKPTSPVCRSTTSSKGQPLAVAAAIEVTGSSSITGVLSSQKTLQRRVSWARGQGAAAVKRSSICAAEQRLPLLLDAIPVVDYSPRGHQAVQQQRLGTADDGQPRHR